MLAFNFYKDHLCLEIGKTCHDLTLIWAIISPWKTVDLLKLKKRYQDSKRKILWIWKVQGFTRKFKAGIQGNDQDRQWTKWGRKVCWKELIFWNLTKGDWGEGKKIRNRSSSTTRIPLIMRRKMKTLANIGVIMRPGDMTKEDWEVLDKAEERKGWEKPWMKWGDQLLTITWRFRFSVFFHILFNMCH